MLFIELDQQISLYMYLEIFESKKTSDWLNHTVFANQKVH